MIPYDDLVSALQAWRARQGLPVAVTARAGSAPVIPTTPAFGINPITQPGSGPRTAPPPAPRTNPPRAPLPLAAPADSLDEQLVDDGAMIEEAHYENEGDDFAMAFAAGGPPPAEDESTQIGGAPERPSDATDPVGGRRNPDREDW